MANPSSGWDAVPVFGFYFRDRNTPDTGTVAMTVSQRVNTVNGRRIYAAGAKVVRTVGVVAAGDAPLVEQVRAAWRETDQAAEGGAFDGAAWDAWWALMLQGIVIAGFPASDDPDIVPQGYQVTVTEQLSNSQIAYAIQPMLADLDRTPPGLNLGLVDAGAAEVEFQPIYQKGAPGGVAALDAEGDVLNAAGEKVGLPVDVDQALEDAAADQTSGFRLTLDPVVKQTLAESSTDQHSQFRQAFDPVLSATVAAGVEEQVGPLVVAGVNDVTSPIGAAVAARSRPPLIDNLREPFIVAHRGGGLLVYPEHAMVGYKAAADSGFIPEQDLWPLADGTLVCCHDATVDRTMTGATGNISALTPAQWRTLWIKPQRAGLPRQRPVFWTEVLDALGGRTILTPEVKSAADLESVIESVTVRGLQRSVIVTSTSFEVASAAAAAGIGSAYLGETVGTTGRSYAEVIAAGIDYLIISKASATQARVQGIVAAGVRVIVYTVDNKPEFDNLVSWGASGIYANDPWRVDQNYNPITIREQFDSGQIGGGTAFYDGAAGAVTYDPAVPALKFTHLTSANWDPRVSLGRFGWGTSVARVRFFAKVGASLTASPATSWHAAVFIGSKVSAPPHDLGTDEVVWYVELHHDGSGRFIFRNLGTSTVLGSWSADPTNYPTDGSAGREFEYEFEVTATNCYLRNITLGTTPGSATHSGGVIDNAFVTIGARHSGGHFRDIRLVR